MTPERRAALRWHRVDVALHAVLLTFALAGLIGHHILARREDARRA